MAGEFKQEDLKVAMNRSFNYLPFFDKILTFELVSYIIMNITKVASAKSSSEF